MEWGGEFSHFAALQTAFSEQSKRQYPHLVAENEDGDIVGQVFLSLLSSQSELADGIHRAYLFSFRLKPDYPIMDLAVIFSIYENYWSIGVLIPYASTSP
jgi:hypothetical protein